MQALRTDNGIWVAELPAELANKLISECAGKVTIKKFRKDGEIKEEKVFLIEQEGVLRYGDVRLMLWKGFYLEL